MKKIYLTFLVGLFLCPSLLISQTVSISGKVTRHNGDPVSNVNVNCNNTVLTNATGDFEFSDVNINTMCDVYLDGDFDQYEGVTILDFLVLQNHILQIGDELNNYQVIEGDVNGSLGITAYDLVLTSKLALKFDDALSMDWDWIGIDASYDFSNFNFPIPTSISVTATDTLSNLDFIAMRKGDPAIDSDYIPAPPEAPSPVFTISDESFQAGDEVEFEVTVEDFENILGFQNTFKWDPSVLSFNSIDEISGVEVYMNEENITQGILPLMTHRINIVLEDGDIALKLKFTALTDSSPSMELLSFSDEVTPRQIVWQNPFNGELFIVDGEYFNGEGVVTSLAKTPTALKIFEIFPNPVSEVLNVKVLLGKEQAVTLTIVNALGQKVYLQHFNQNELLVPVNFEQQPAGTYFLILQTADGIQPQSFIKQ